MTTRPTAPAAASAAVAGLRGLHEQIDALQGIAERCSPTEHDGVLVEIERGVRRLESLKLQVVGRADAAEVAARTGHADTSSWLARLTHTGAAGAAEDVRLASALSAPSRLDSRPCAEALSAGALSPEHARVIVKATEQLPGHLDADGVERVERDLVQQAERLAPDQLRRAARRALEIVETDRAAVDSHEDGLLRAEEKTAIDKTRLTWHDNGDGTTSGHFTVPTLASSILIRAVQSMTAPRRARLGAPSAQAGDPLLRRDRAHQSGLAFLELLEHLPTDRLHGKVAATVVVTIDHDRLRAAVGAAALDTGDSISPGELRRLACGAGILPAVLEGASLPLDLGRASRLFTEPQRVALGTRHRTCAAEGCERPYAWCELHHRERWSQGGRTDLRDAVPLCGFHHRRVHDPSYGHTCTSSGIVFFRRT
jgi:hypothetical protein